MTDEERHPAELFAGDPVPDGWEPPETPETPAEAAPVQVVMAPPEEDEEPNG